MKTASSKQSSTSLWYLYIIETAKGRLYTGITTNVQRRFMEHSKGKGAKYFRLDSPKQVIYQCEFPDRSSATKEEIRIKSLSRGQKLLLVKNSDVNISNR
ncbi:GIY-YIG nuclease family protein [Motiliproteus sp. MSK22-1]|uniref:GIY-YIG nuclease family protein n=1 Tax=Motiliproteus sp. MSK22-1 TaxID=1897630 RepID=UPI000975D5A4|nr:GIY-YIG nuclease family protein [Motiliproteus sp. MSK22-1]OMH33951.1 hypothetical protein BGP75_13370 [Motiliproteus sp. MSK22-1]